MGNSESTRFWKAVSNNNKSFDHDPDDEHEANLIENGDRSSRYLNDDGSPTLIDVYDKEELRQRLEINQILYHRDFKQCIYNTDRLKISQINKDEFADDWPDGHLAFWNGGKLTFFCKYGGKTDPKKFDYTRLDPNKNLQKRINAEIVGRYENKLLRYRMLLI